jgi:hypothetical protein
MMMQRTYYRFNIEEQIIKHPQHKTLVERIIEVYVDDGEVIIEEEKGVISLPFDLEFILDRLVSPKQTNAERV